MSIHTLPYGRYIGYAIALVNTLPYGDVHEKTNQGLDEAEANRW
jgi:hypothetical protein